ncbi:MAG: cysteine--tRNA ligase, partial [Sulfurimonadaceae bacterium]|nr:cysteine--tRNA ligase [Sulfurimonadaceae bacterium]
LKKEIVANLAYIEKVLGFGIKNPFEYFQLGVDIPTKEKIFDLIVLRDKAKQEKDFKGADALRDAILALGVSIMDTPEGTFWERL